MFLPDRSETEDAAKDMSRSRAHVNTCYRRCADNCLPLTGREELFAGDETQAKIMREILLILCHIKPLRLKINNPFGLFDFVSFQSF